VGSREVSRAVGDLDFGVDRRRVLLAILVALALGAGAVGLLGMAAEYGEMLKAFRRADESWFPVCLAGVVLAYIGYVLSYRDAARAAGGPRLPYWSVTRVVAVGFGAFVVGSSAGGLAVDFWALRRAGAGLHEAARRVLALNTLEWLSLTSAAALAGLLVLMSSREGVPTALPVAWIVVVPAAVLAAAWVSSPQRAERLAKPKTSANHPSGWKVRAWLAWVGTQLRKGLADAVGGVALVRHIVLRPHRYPLGLVGFPLYWASHLLVLYAALRAFTDEPVGIPALVLAYATGYIATALGSLWSLHLVGIALAPALLAALVYRFFTFWLPIVPAVFFLPTLKRLNRDLPRTKREPGKLAVAG
jgi:uncharacterized membrane protein YbhN (UPF0104 family)